MAILPAGELDEFFAGATEPLPRVIRVNKNFVQPEGWTLKKTAISDAFFIDRKDRDRVPMGRTLPHFCGEIYSQSLSSMLPVVALDPVSGEKILDFCAAPGSKTTFCSEKMDGGGVVVANEISSSRSKKLAANVDRIFCQNVVLTQFDGVGLNKIFGQEFDKILLDAPCSSEAFGRRDSKFFAKMWSERAIFESAKLQKKLIVAAFEALRPGGTLVYSTCTSAPEENESVVQFLCSRFPKVVEICDVGADFSSKIPFGRGVSGFDFSEKVVRIWPHRKNEFWDSEQFFCAKIRKILPCSIAPPVKFCSKNLFKICSKKSSAEICVRLSKKFGFPRDFLEKNSILSHENGIFLASREAANFAVKNPCRRVGIRILDSHGNISTEFAVRFGRLANKNFVQLSNFQVEKFLAGTDFQISDFPEFSESGAGTEIIARAGGRAIGHFKIAGRILKNKLDRGRVFR